MAKNLRHIGALVSADALVSVTDGDGAYMEYDIAGTNARIGAKGGVGANRGLLIRTLAAGVALTVLTFTSAGAATFVGAVNTQALTATTGTFSSYLLPGVAIGPAGSIGGTASVGVANIARSGSLYDWSVYDPTAANYIIAVPTGTRNVLFGGTAIFASTITVSAGGLNVNAGISAVQALVVSGGAYIAGTAPTASGALQTAFGVLAALPSSNTQNFIATTNGIAGTSAGDLCLIARSDIAASVLVYAGTTTPALRLTVHGAGSVIVGTTSVLTTATDGFLYIPAVPGAPTGVPTSFGGRVPMVYDVTNNFFYFFNSGWKKSSVYA